jgi:hypothetical protein
MNQIGNDKILEIVSDRLQTEGLKASEITIRDFPDESIVVVRVDQAIIDQVVVIANRLDTELSSVGFNGFVTVKSSKGRVDSSDLDSSVKDLQDDRVTQFANLLVARSRTSEIQPSLKYVRDVKANVDSATSSRHHLIFGRRGSGKTALLAEAKSRVEADGDLAVWVNAQTFRHESAIRFFLSICIEICDILQASSRNNRLSARLVSDSTVIIDQCNRLLAKVKPDTSTVRALVPKVQRLIKRMTIEIDGRLLVFIDDLHYISRTEQPSLLDLLHGSVRDCDAWLKIATIQHLTHWFDSTNQLGLQSGHDASHIDLDLSLQDAAQAKEFLEQVLSGFAEHTGINSYTRIFSQRGTLDRLVIASGAVPRDYLMLCSAAIQIARQRPNARTVGVQDINKAAGDAKQKKIDELEDDAASSKGDSIVALETLGKLKSYCLETKSCTFFRVDFEEKDKYVEAYGHLQILMDLRLIHLIEPSLSDKRIAGRKSEVFLLDLSQFAGQRLKRKLTVLDLMDGFLVLKQTGSSAEPRLGNTSSKKVAILRQGPVISLQNDLG